MQSPAGETAGPRLDPVGRIDLLDRAADDQDLKRRELRILTKLAKYYNFEKGYAFPSQARLAAETGLTKRWVTDALDGLGERGYVVSEPHAYRDARGQLRIGRRYRLQFPPEVIHRAPQLSEAEVIPGAPQLAPEVIHRAPQVPPEVLPGADAEVIHRAPLTRDSGNRASRSGSTGAGPGGRSQPAPAREATPIDPGWWPDDEMIAEACQRYDLGPGELSGVTREFVAFWVKKGDAKILWERAWWDNLKARRLRFEAISARAATVGRPRRPDNLGPPRQMTVEQIGIRTTVVPTARTG